jgi:hypothetical protein
MRLSKTGGRTFMLRRYIFLDSMLPYPQCRFTIRLVSSENLRMERIKKRDSSQGVHSVRSWEKMEITAKLLDESDYKFDLVLNGDLKTKDNAAKIVEYLKSKRMIG